MKKIILILSLLSLMGCSERPLSESEENSTQQSLLETEKNSKTDLETEKVLSTVDENQEKWFEEDYKKFNDSHAENSK